MKKLFALLALVLGVVSCQTEPEGFDVVVGGEQEVMLNVSLPEATRANSAEGFNFANLGEYNIRYILEIAYNDHVLREVKTSNTTSTTFPVRLAPGREYTFTVWADLVTATTIDKDTWYTTDNFYDTSAGLSNITFNTNTWTPNTEARDAWTDTKKVTFTGASGIQMDLTRPFAKVRVVATDIAEIRKFDIKPTSAKVEYTTPMYTAFDAVTGKVAGNAEAKTIEFAYSGVDAYEDVTTTNSLTLLADYIFVPADGIIKFTLGVNGSDDKLIKSNTFNTQIPVERNKVTSIVGNVLTQGDDIKVNISNGFDTPGYEVKIWDGESIVAPAYDENAKTYTINEPSQLAWLAAAVSGTLPDVTRATIPADSFAGKTFILINDVDLGGNEWTPIGMGGKHFEGTFDGNGKTIKGLRVAKRHAASQAALFCSLAGNAVIKDVVIDEAYIKYPNDGKDFYASAIAGTIYGTVKFEEIRVKNSTITGNNKIGAIFAHDGSSTQITVDNCHVDNCYIASEDTEDGGNVGGLIGLYQTGSTNACKISNSSVKNSTIVGINSKNNGKRANSEFIGGILTKTNTNLVLENCVVENNNFSQTIDGSAAVTYVGAFNPQFIGGDRDEKVLGKVTINGRDDVYVDSADEFQTAVSAATGETTIRFAKDIEGNVTVIQKQGVKINVEGDGKKYNGVIKVHSNSNHYADAALTIKNVDFETAAASINVIEALEDGAERYSTNITVDSCTFTATGEAVNTSVGVQIKSSKNAKVINCTATNMHSLLQAQSCDETVVVNGCTINGKNGVAFKQVKAATVEDTTITAVEYGIRFDGNTDNYGITVKENTVTAAQPFIVRKMTGKNNTIALEGENTLTTEKAYQIVITNGSDDEEYVKPTGTYTLTGADNYTIFPALPVAKIGTTEYTSIDEAIANWTNGTTLTLVANVTLKDVITLNSTEHHILNLGTYTLTAASGKNAIEITPKGAGTAARSCLTINADASEPGCIEAGSKACIYYKKTDGSDDRLMVTINGGIYNGTISSSSNNGGQACPYFVFNGGVFNKSINLTKAMLKVTGGIFHGMFSCTGDQTAHRLISGGTFKSFTFMTADAANKFCIGTDKQTYNVGLYINDEGYLVVGGPVITEFGDKFAAKATNPTKWSSYLQYSSAAEHGLYYTNADAAIKKHGADYVEFPSTESQE